MNGKNRTRGPAMARWVARVLLSVVDAERLLEALDQEYSESQGTGRGRIRTDAWYWRQVVTSIGPLRGSARRRATRRGQPRSVWGAGGGRGSWTRDVAYGLRKLARNRVYSTVAILTLALGIGANAALFSVVRSVLLAPLPYDAPERIYRAWAHADDGSIRDFSFRVSELKELAGRSGGMEAVGAEFPMDVTVLGPGQEPLQLPARMVSAGFFDVFGVSPARGRMFEAAEIEAGEALVTVVSHGFAERRWGGAAEAVGQSLTFGSGAYTVLGVLPPGYEHVSGADVDLFVPYTIGTSGWIAHWLDLYIRAGPSVGAARVQEEVNDVLRAVGEVESRSRGWNATVEPLHQMVVGDVRIAVWAVFGTATLVLLIACVNVAILALARAILRRGEIGLRTALGAGRGRIVRQLLVENLILSLAGGAAGTVVAWGGVRTLVALAPASIPRIHEASVDLGVLAFALAVTLVTGVAFGLFPALAPSAVGSSGLVGGQGKTTGRGAGRLFGALVTAQVALSVTLLVGAGLLIDGFRTLQREDMGFDRVGTLAFRIVVPSARYPRAADTDAFYSRLRGEISALPGVLSVGAGSNLPVSGDGAIAGVTTQARVEAGIDEAVTVLQRRASAGFFDAMGTPLIEGRGFDLRDRADAPATTVISATLADALFPGESAVGERVGWGRAPDEDDWMTVIGVVEEVRYRGPDVSQHPQLYQAHSQSAVRDMAVIVRTAGDPTALIEPARGVLRELDPQIPFYAVTTLGDLVNRAVAGRRFTMTLFSVFALLALALTASGLYGVLTFGVQQRRRELGVRMALGAAASQVTGLVVGRAMGMTLAGVILGVVGAAVGYRLLGSLLYEVSPLDPGVYATGIGLLAVVALVAAYVPARSAARVEPMGVLREE